uniref:START domain-containing protein n=1 Tax=Globisporangium ultimum (strain ATCC 200006 / CBS 805.95 / DAOM BR144) TaxID=431595 RepID=K3WXE9_GLOUD
MATSAFPLPAAVFPAMKFSTDETVAFIQCRDRLVNATMVARREFRDRCNGKLNEAVWKVVKRKQDADFAVFTPRRRAMIPKPSNSRTCSPILIAAGSIKGSLNDVMLGFSSATTDAMAFATPHLYKDVLDARVVATLQCPSEAEPFEYLGFKWMAKGPSTFAMKNFVRPRDFVYLESTGIQHDNGDGTKVGYVMIHSVALGGCRSLRSEFGIVRGALSFCYLFSESTTTPGSVDVFCKGFLDPRGHGGVTEHMTLASAAEGIMACLKAPKCARMKKYEWIRKNRLQGDDSNAVESTSQSQGLSNEDGRCSVCHAETDIASREQTAHCCRDCACIVELVNPLQVAKDEAGHTLETLRRSSTTTPFGMKLTSVADRIHLTPLKKRTATVPAPIFSL